ncbi:MAG: TfoX/Sxy family protein [Kiloniellales bacterium]
MPPKAPPKSAKTVPASVARALFLLLPLGPVRARAMFGGHGLYLNAAMIGLIARDRLYLKVDETTKARFAEAGGEPFVYERHGKTVEMSYWTLPERQLSGPEALLPWAELALAAARRARFAKTTGRATRLQRRSRSRSRFY